MAQRKKQSQRERETENEISDTQDDPDDLGKLRISDILRIGEDLESFPIKYLRTLIPLAEQISAAFQPVRTFVAQLDRAKGTAAARDASPTATVDRTPAPAAPRKRQTGMDSSDGLAQEIRGVLSRDPMTIGEIAKALNRSDPKVLAPAMKALVQSGHAVQSGQARGTRYAKA